MSWVIVAVAGTAVVSAGVSAYSSKKAAKSSQGAAATEAQAKQNELNYLMEREALPRQFSEGALTKLGGLYGLEGGEGSQQELIDQAMDSPLYQNLMGNQAFGEEAILRNQAATGGFRSGNTQVNLSEYNTRLRNEALLQSYNEQLGGLQSMANLPSNAGQIGSAMSGVGKIKAAGEIGAAQARQAGYQGIANTVGQAGTSLAMYYSDIRLKKNIKFQGSSNGHNIYSWVWNDKAKRLGLEGKSLGVLAHEIYTYMPEAITVVGGDLMVDYSMLAIDNGGVVING